MWKNLIAEEDHGGEEEKEDGGGHFHGGGVFFLKADQGITGHAAVGENKNDDQRQNEGEVIEKKEEHGVGRALLDFKDNGRVNLTGASQFEQRNENSTDKSRDDKIPRTRPFSDHSLNAFFEKTRQLQSHVLQFSTTRAKGITQTQNSH